MDHCGPLWTIVDHCGPLWTIVDLCGPLLITAIKASVQVFTNTLGIAGPCDVCVGVCVDVPCDVCVGGVWHAGPRGMIVTSACVHILVPTRHVKSVAFKGSEITTFTLQTFLLFLQHTSLPLHPPPFYILHITLHLHTTGIIAFTPND